jgi:DNA-directed RNA polymerase subunit RPC12/RpoP
MSKKIYVCRNCGNTFPDELSHLIESKTKVYCERCGTPFSIEGIKFREPQLEIKKKEEKHKKSPEEKSSMLEGIIKALNYISWIPILILSIILLFIPIHFPMGIAGIIISIYDKKYISKRIKEKNYDHIVLDSICLGILGGIIFGTGAILILKGVLIFIYEVVNSKGQTYYEFGLKMKNSLNNFSALGAIIILLYAIDIFINFNILPERPMGIFVISIIFVVSSIIVDLSLKNKIKVKVKFSITDALILIFFGIIGLFIAAAGIFILLKGIVILFLLFGKPPKIKETEVIEAIPIEDQVKHKRIEKPIYKERIEKQIYPAKKVDEKEPKRLTPEEIIEPKEKSRIDETIEMETRLHDSLLPIKDEKDKKLVKQYFSKIFTVLSKDIRKQIMDLEIPEKEKKELLKELAYLTKEEQIKYIEAIVNLYVEKLPIKLIERIRSLPNVKPEHLVKIAEQLKFMDFDEQERYIQFLENNA